MTYKQLQAQLKTARTEGRIPASFKLNQKKEILQKAWDALTANESADEAAKDREYIKSVYRKPAYAGEVTLLYIDNGIPAYGFNFEQEFAKAVKEYDCHLVPMTQLGDIHGHTARTVAVMYK